MIIVKCIREIKEFKEIRDYDSELYNNRYCPCNNRFWELQSQPRFTKTIICTTKLTTISLQTKYKYKIAMFND